ncbi:beta-lactamase-like protein [Daedaleopsis nitida]|nr:beta-lactamase-like protein [Daedaleopsis nitida]
MDCLQGDQFAPLDCDAEGSIYLKLHPSHSAPVLTIATTGLLMLSADAAVPSMDIVGPYGLMQYLATMRGYVYRSTMAVKAVEAPTTPVYSPESVGEPSPVFKDENITVYSIPLYPSADVAMAEDSPARNLKRKRSPSPPTSFKRPSASVPVSDQIAQSTTPVASALTAHAEATDFIPAVLTGADAQEWRKLMLQEMFPMQSPPEADSTLSTKEKRQARKALKESDEPPPRSRLVSGEKKYARLPQLGLSNGLGPRSLPTLAYLCIGPVVRGKFDVRKAQELGLPKGPIRAQLTKGETVMFEVDDGNGGKVQKTVRPEDCVGPSEMPQAIIILDVPTRAHIPALMASFTESPFFSSYRSKDDATRKLHPVHAVYHMCGDGVLEDEQYKAFMNGFSNDTHHLIFSRQHTPNKIAFTRSAHVQAKLHQLDADLFPLPKYEMSPDRDFSSVDGLPPKAVLALPDTILRVRPLRPPMPDENAKDDEFNPLAAKGLLPVLSSSVMEKFAAAKARVSDRVGRNSPASQLGDDVVVTPLGTGSALPTKMRNVSGTLVQIPGHGTILLDCGENTWGQLARSFGDDPCHVTGVWEVLRDLKCIFLSHMHGDHHMGLSKILMMRASMDPPPSQPLYVVGLRPHLTYMLERHELEDHGLSEPNSVVMILSDALNWRPARPYGKAQSEDEPFMNVERSRENAREMCRDLGLKTFTTVDVAHRVRCYGVVLRHHDGWGLAFSGDTMPTENLVKVGRDVTLLIHESSMSPDEEALAREKAHSTSAQAIDVGRRMRAQKLLLTHFSARYPGMPPRQGDGDASGGPLIGLAFDYSRIRLGDMWKLNAYLPAIQHTFDEFGDEDPVEIDLTKLQ